MTDLVGFLRARLDEDEQAARAAEDETGLRWEDNGFGVFVWGTAQPIAVGRHDGCIPDDARAHIARHDPARVLAEVDAKRRILDVHVERAECTRCEWFDDEFYPCETLRLLALPYAGYPDYHEEWKP